MNQHPLDVFEFDNGLVLLVETMRHVQSAAFSVLTPAGTIHEPSGANGTSAALCDLMSRGAGNLNSQQLTAALDNLGVQHNENVGWNFITFSGATLAENVIQALPYYASILREPQLDLEQFPAVMSGVEQSLLAEEDEPQRKVLTELRRHAYDAPWNRPTDGTLEDLDAITPESVIEHYKTHVRPNGTLIGVAGNVDPLQIRDVVGKAFGDWKPHTAPEVVTIPGTRESRHISYPSSQTHIGVAYNAVPYGHPDYYAAWAAISILSGGFSSRLFTELRERRGLCYSVFATLHTLLTEARVLAYAGTSTSQAQMAFDVMVEELRKLGKGIEPAELARCQARAKSSLIMQQESTESRATSIARDWFHLKRVNSLADIRAALDSLTIDKIVDYANRYPAENLTVLTIGEEPIVVPQD